MGGFAIILGFNFIGMLLQEWAHVPLPAGVIGLLLFSFSLFMGWIKLSWVEESAQLLLNHLLLFFAPIIVGTMTLFPLIGQYWASIFASLTGGTLIVLFVTAWTTRLLGRKEADPDEAA